MKTHLIVVGAGLFGSVIAKMAEAHGIEVTLLDDGRPGAGSPPSAGLIKPSWLKGFGQAAIQGLATLESLYPIRRLPFDLGLGIEMDLLYLNPRTVIRQGGTTIRAKVEEAGPGYVRTAGGVVYRGYVVVATGSWVKELFPDSSLRLEVLRGSAFLYEGTVARNTLRPWAPYKQIKVYQAEEHMVWTGDSTGLLPKSYTTARKGESQQRCEDALYKAGFTPRRQAAYTELTGDRPVVKGEKAGVFEQVYPNTWVSTGGGKMGSVLAGYHALRFIEEVTRG